MKNYLLMIFVIFIISCSKQEDQKLDNIGVNVDRDINISVKDSAGNDLLDPENPQAIRESEIWLYYLIDGKKEKVYIPNLDHPRNFFIFKDHRNYDSSEYIIRVFPNDEKSNSYPITYIQWNNADTDTIKCEIERTEYEVRCTKVWYNGELKWKGNDTWRYFEIIK